MNRIGRIGLPDRFECEFLCSKECFILSVNNKIDSARRDFQLTKQSIEAIKVLVVNEIIFRTDARVYSDKRDKHMQLMQSVILSLLPGNAPNRIYHFLQMINQFVAEKLMICCFCGLIECLNQSR